MNAKHSLDLSVVLSRSIHLVRKRKEKSVQRQTSISDRPPLRQIMRIVRKPDKLAYYELLSCGHYGQIAEGPQREYIPLKGLVNARRCEECRK